MSSFHALCGFVKLVFGFGHLWSSLCVDLGEAVVLLQKWIQRVVGVTRCEAKAAIPDSRSGVLGLRFTQEMALNRRRQRKPAANTGVNNFLKAHGFNPLDTGLNWGSQSLMVLSETCLFWRSSLRQLLRQALCYPRPPVKRTFGFVGTLRFHKDQVNHKIGGQISYLILVPI